MPERSIASAFLATFLRGPHALHCAMNVVNVGNVGNVGLIHPWYGYCTGIREMAARRSQTARRRR